MAQLDRNSESQAIGVHRAAGALSLAEYRVAGISN
jgi:hypothetical protein